MGKIYAEAGSGDRMSEHYQRNTVEVSAWCNRCGKDTPHRVDAPKLGPCLVCLARLEQPTIPGIVEELPEQLTLMDVTARRDIG